MRKCDLHLSIHIYDVQTHCKLILVLHSGSISENETKSFDPQDKLLIVYGIKLGTLCVKIKKFGRIGNEKMRLEFMYSYNIKTNL